MKNRFKFICGIEADYYKDNGEDAEVLFVFETDTIGYGTAAFYYSDLNAFIAKLDLTEKEENSLMDFFIRENQSDSEDVYWMEVDFKEQCTGLKDKNRKLIYGGDKFTYTKHQGYILESFTGIVVWNEEYACFGYKRIIDGNICNTFNPFTEHDELDFDFLPYIEVIGNIHENKEFLT